MMILLLLEMLVCVGCWRWIYVVLLIFQFLLRVYKIKMSIISPRGCSRVTLGQDIWLRSSRTHFGLFVIVRDFSFSFLCFLRLLRLDQSEISISQCQPIRDQYCFVSTNQKPVLVCVNQSEASIYLHPRRLDDVELVSLSQHFASIFVIFIFL